MVAFCRPTSPGSCCRPLSRPGSAERTSNRSTNMSRPGEPSRSSKNLRPLNPSVQKRLFFATTSGEGGVAILRESVRRRIPKSILREGHAIASSAAGIAPRKLAELYCYALAATHAD